MNSSTKFVVLNRVLLLMLFTLPPLGAAEIHLSDQTITMHVQRKFKNDIRLRDADIKVRTFAGVVTLTGEMSTFLDKHHAERLCKQVDGVREVRCQLKVNLFAQSDQEIAAAIKQRWERDSVIHSEHLTVEVDRHVVTLRGIAKSWREKRGAGRLAREVRDVALVLNKIEVLTD